MIAFLTGLPAFVRRLAPGLAVGKAAIRVHPCSSVSFGLVFAAVGWISPADATERDIAVLQGLDKVTARVTTIDVPVGQTVRFGTLEIIPRTCDKRPPEETPESAAFVDIWEVRAGEAAQSLFRGWMFASSPALSALEHPVYDVWVIDCKNAPAAESPPETPPPAAQ